MYWDHGELNLLKGVVSQQSSTRNGRLRYRRVLKNLHFNKSLGQFVERRLQKKNRLRTRFKVDVENYNLLRSAITEKQLQVPLQKGAEVEAVSVGDTGASVTCCGGRLMQDLGWKVSDLLETEVRLFAANKKQLTVLGALPVHIKVKSADGTSEISMRDLLYVVEELAASYLSRETLVGLGPIPEYFPMPLPRREYGQVSAIRGTASDMEEDKTCHMGVISKGEAARVGVLSELLHQTHQACHNQQLKSTESRMRTS